MFKRYKYRLYPNKAQKVLLEKHFGCCRLVYNLALEVKQQAYISNRVHLSAFDLHKQITDLKKDLTWLKEVNIQSLQQSVTNLDKAFTQFFKYGAKYPKFKNKRSNKSFTCTNHVRVDFDSKKVIIPKFKEGIKCVFSRKFNDKPKNTVISRTSTGKYFITIVIDNKEALPKKSLINNPKSIGIDLGLKSFAVTSEGEIFENPKYLKVKIDRLKVLQRRLSKTKKGSKNRLKAIKRVALLHEKIANQRTDFLHKLSSKLISENQAIYIENLNVKGMVKNPKLAQSISDVGWGMFTQFLKYKADWYGKNVIEIGRFEPSSKLCSHCGATNHELTLDIRNWICANCGANHDRDVNAAINIKNFGLKISRRGTPIEPLELPTMVGAMKKEELH